MPSFFVLPMPSNLETSTQGRGTNGKSTKEFCAKLGLVSSHVLEVQAALFAAGCFAELSEDFACVVLEMLLHMMSSPETLPAIRLAGARLFAKLGCSQSLANNAYKASLKLLLEFSDEYYQVAMLVSLSKLSSKSTILISQQVDLLLLFLSHEKTLHLRATALRCLHFIFSQGMCHVPVNGYLVKRLLSILDEPQIPTSMLWIAGLKSKANRVHNEEGLSQLPKDGLKLMYDILMKWMQIPFRTPTYFFKFRPCRGSELFAVNETRNPDEYCFPRLQLVIKSVSSINKCGTRYPSPV
ncbi:uncharacterized protein Pyn_38183 [Prunus yedoensis var. nudiflora]|uniref:Integrator complex subunit 7 N-terminal domain-containing protein n=1 Tax=Prunus yedoensis var. nudiflora TaxID=2094558 RepID=A0A314XLE2_PRUYE|nr:uncharacterized protein Pyn_38183 [Prunus yedoensis var. nudiflora]